MAFGSLLGVKSNRDGGSVKLDCDSQSKFSY